MKIAIIGAGISGLTTAFYLQRARPEWEFALFDANPAPGGTMHTADVEGFRFEAGGNGFLTNKPDALQLVEDAGANALLLPSSDAARRRFIYQDRLHRLPESPPAFLRSKLISWPAKLRVAGEFFVPARKTGAPETLQQFGYRRLGKGFTDVCLDGMVAGIYATTPDRISVDAAFLLVTALERDYGGLFRALLAKKRAARRGGTTAGGPADETRTSDPPPTSATEQTDLSIEGAGFGEVGDRRDLDLLHAEGGRMMSVGLHCRLAGRPGRAAALARFLDYVASFDDVWVCRRIDIARHWIQHFPVDEV